MPKPDTIILFGSAARRENGPESDLDILVARDGGSVSSIKKDRVEVQITPMHTLIEDAKNGDLFMIHIAFEGVAISDPSGFFQELKEVCHIRRNYDDERNEARLLACYILSIGGKFDGSYFLNKRLAWCIRTIVISQAVEAGRIIFSPNGLRDFYSKMDIGNLLSLRRSNAHPSTYSESLREFLEMEGAKGLLHKTSDQLRTELFQFGRSLSVATVRRLDGQDFTDRYCE